MNLHTVKLGEIGEFKAGFGFPHKFQGQSTGDFPFAKVGDISAVARKGDKHIFSAGNFVTREDLPLLKAKTIPAGTIVFAKIGEAIRQNFRAVTSCEMLIDNNSMGLIPNTKLIDTDYLYHFMCQLDLYRYTGATTVPALRKSTLEDIELSLPPLDEQKRIAKILDKADEVRRKRHKAINLADDFLRAVFLKMFGDPISNPHGFKTRVLSEFYIDEKNGTKCGPFGSALKKEEYTDDGIPVWNMDNITLNAEFIDSPSLWINEQKYSDLEAYSVRQGDIIISRAGTVGKMGVVRSSSSKSIISTNLIRVRFGSDLLPEYFVALMTYGKGRVGRLQTGPDGAFTHMNTGILNTLEFPYPPIELQKKYLEIRHQVVQILGKKSFSQDHLNSNFQALSQKAFSGQL